MKFTASLIVAYAAVALAAVTDPLAPNPELLNIRDDEADSLTKHDFPTLEKRRSCSGNRLSYEVCQGSFHSKRNSYHNCYRAGGHCCARNRNGDYAITVTNQQQHGEDCGYCFTGRCKVENP